MDIPFWTQRGTIDLANLAAADLSGFYIADSLAKLNRFSGRTDLPWSVAAHSVLVADLCRLELKPWALLHDAHEAFIGDMTSPALDFICQFGPEADIKSAFAAAKGRLDRSIASAWQVSVRSQSLALRKADQIALVAEAKLFLGTRPELSEPGDCEFLEEAISILDGMRHLTDWRIARDRWLQASRNLEQKGLMKAPVHYPHDMSSAVL